MKKILLLSGASYDQIITRDSFPIKPQTIHKTSYKESPGLTGIGKAAHLCRLGFNTTLHAVIGYYEGMSIEEGMKYGTVTAGLCIESNMIAPEELSKNMILSLL